MTYILPGLGRSMRLLCLSAVAAICAPTLAAGNGAAAEAAARYQRERAACTSGASSQDRATCLREAAASHAQRRTTSMQDDEAAFEQNARKRCEALPSDERKACLARMQGQGSTSGSVSGGGISRELVTTEPAAPGVARPSVDAPKAPPK